MSINPTDMPVEDNSGVGSSLTDAQRGFVTNRQGTSSATVVSPYPPQTVLGSKPFGTYDWPNRNGASQ